MAKQSVIPKSNHKYFKGIGFYYIEREQFDILLDQVKTISINDYYNESLDGFQELVKYWNERGRRAFTAKLISNQERIKYLK